MVYMERTNTFFPGPLDLDLNISSLFFCKFSMPKKLTPKSQAKFKPPISAIPFFNPLLTLKRYYRNK